MLLENVMFVCLFVENKWSNYYLVNETLLNDVDLYTDNTTEDTVTLDYILELISEETISSISFDSESSELLQDYFNWSNEFLDFSFISSY
ncbi:unnamed protein product [Adineta ricciae]|uniref:Uncharacterized protein n=1 Tax=Adineta ricciae TaxID=249248 RepID=A0A814AHF5_ADIRI|nr:unnamed protein product [Adineta ricciae]